MRILIFLSILLLLVPGLGHTEDLLAVYQLAEQYDPSLQAAKETQLATQELFPQARALFLPTINVSASNTTYSKKYKASNISVSSLTIPLSSPNFRYDQNVYALTLSQP